MFFLVVSDVTHENTMLKYHYTFIADYTPKMAATQSINGLEMITPDSDSMCGVKLNIGQTYLLFSQLRNDQMVLSLCGSIITEIPAPQAQRSGRYLMKGVYKAMCQIPQKEV